MNPMTRLSLMYHLNLQFPLFPKNHYFLMNLMFHHYPQYHLFHHYPQFR
jgi:hypothetical protein